MPLIVKILVFALFLAFAMFCLYFMFKAFILLQIKIGNGNLWIVKTLRDNERQFLIGMAIFYAVGLVIALPAMIAGGFFSD